MGNFVHNFACFSLKGPPQIVNTSAPQNLVLCLFTSSQVLIASQVSTHSSFPTPTNPPSTEGPARLRSQFKYYFYHLVPLWPWVRHLSSMNFIFLTCKRWIIIIPILKGYFWGSEIMSEKCLSSCSTVDTEFTAPKTFNCCSLWRWGTQTVLKSGKSHED